MNTPQFLNILKDHIHKGGKVVLNNNYCIEFQDKTKECDNVCIRIYNPVQGYWINLNSFTIKKVSLANNMFNIETIEDSDYFEIILVKEVFVEQ